MGSSRVGEASAAPGRTHREAAAGPAAALVIAAAAGVLATVARASGAEAEAAQAAALYARSLPLAQADAEAYAAALARLAIREGSPQADFHLGVALEQTADVLLQIAAAAADVGELAVVVADRAAPDLKPDAVAAAMLAEGSARAAALLVEINLAVSEGDERMHRARASVEAAANAVERALAAGA